MNLLKETIEILRDSHKSPAQVKYVQTSEGSFSWDTFKSLADFNYRDGFGLAEVNLTLKVVGDDWWLERGEYDGSEWWEFKALPTMRQPFVPKSKNLKCQD